jgi:hypothetical protein
MHMFVDNQHARTLLNYAVRWIVHIVVYVFNFRHSSHRNPPLRHPLAEAPFSWPASCGPGDMSD